MQTNLSMDFADPTQFSFVQMSRDISDALDLSFEMVHSVGHVDVLPMVAASGSYIHVELKVQASSADLLKSDALQFEKTDSSLLIKTPKWAPRNTPSESAVPKDYHLVISAVITVSPNAKLENLELKTETLAVKFNPGLDYAESRVVETHLAHSNWKSRSAYSRDTIINVESASVTGSYPLYDLLSVHTDSGSIDIEIEPKNASIANIKPAVLHLTSNSGSVRGVTSTTAVPNRDYHSSFSTSSGSINAVALHGFRTWLRSINGHITADLYPFGHNDSRSEIEAHCSSGAMDLTLHPSLSHPQAALKKLYGYYRGGSGNLDLFYPGTWEGTFEATTMSGSIDLDFEGLKIVKDGKEGSAKRKIEGLRGEGEGNLFMYESSGSMKLGKGS